MNWIRIAVGIVDDPSVGALADAIGADEVKAAGHILAVLCQVPLHARDGDLSEVTDRTLEQWGRWRGKRGRFAMAFRRELCDVNGVLRSWEKHNGAAIRESDAARERMSAARAAKRAAKASYKPRRPTSVERSGNPPETFDERSANVPRTFASDGTGRDGILTTTTTTAPPAAAASAVAGPVAALAGCLLLTVAANRGVTDAIGEQPLPLIRAHQPSAQRAAERIAELGIPEDFAASAIYAHAKQVAATTKIRSLGFFVDHVLEQWQAHQTRLAMASYTPTSDPAVEQRDMLRFAAVQYAREGDTVWQEYCETRGIHWQQEAA